MNRSVNIWDIINKLSKDNSLWDYLEPAEIMEIVQRIYEAKEWIKGLEKHIHIDLNRALKKLGSMAVQLHLSSFHTVNHVHIHNSTSFSIPEIASKS